MSKRVDFRLKCPCFDLTWLSLALNNNVQVTNELVVALIPGGGGGAKTGVKNLINVAIHTEKLNFEFLEGFETEDRLCNSISTGYIKGVAVICTSFDDICVLLTVTATTDNKRIRFDKIADFKADFSQESSSINCSAWASRASSVGYLVTGGEDGIARVWSVSNIDDSWEVSKLAELTAHKGPVMSLSVCRPTGHQSKDKEVFWVASASRDGSVVISDLTRGNVLFQLNCATLTDPLMDKAETSVAAVAKKRRGPPESVKKIESRGCIFSVRGDHIFHIQSNSKGTTFLVKSLLKHSSSGNNKSDIPTMSAVTEKVTLVCTCPATRLRASSVVTSANGPDDCESQLVAVGAANGSIYVFRQTDLTLVSFQKEAHDFPVTGLGFYPPCRASEAILTAGAGIPGAVAIAEALNSTAKEEGLLLMSCSADYKMTALRVSDKPPSRSIGWTLLRFFLSLLFMAIVAYLVYTLYFGTALGGKNQDL